MNMMNDFNDEDDELLRQIELDFYEEVGADTVSQEVPFAIPEEFPFPFEPYSIQVGFMKELYAALQGSKIGIFESPTGTGKSLSLICGALLWLKDFEAQQKKELEELLTGEATSKEELEKNRDPGDDWVAAFARKKEIEEQVAARKGELEERLKKEEKLQRLRSTARPVKRKRHKLEEEFDDLFKHASKEVKEQLSAELDNQSDAVQNDMADEDLVVAEYQSDGEDKDTGDLEDSEDDEEDAHVTKIYYCSRTHSQLAQFVREVMKSPYGEETRVVSLGSRQNLCINAAVQRLKSLSLMNDKCMEMQKNKKNKKKGEEPERKRSKGGGCQFYKQDSLNAFRDAALAKVCDIEQLVTIGKQTKACPYYGTRLSIPAAQLVALPYNTLLHKSTRESCGIKLKGQVVIVDEAHNLLETISNVYSVEVTGSQLTCAHSQLNQYMEKFKTRLKAKNLMYIRQILFVLRSLIVRLGGKCGISADGQHTGRVETRLQTLYDFLFETGLDNINMFKLLHYCEKSMIARKLHGFVEKYQPQVQKVEEEQKDMESGLTKFLKQISQRDAKESASHSDQPVGDTGSTAPVMASPLMLIEGFLEALTNAGKDGRIVINKQSLLSQSSLKFLLLNPAIHFAEILQEARSVIIAGGTMQPVSEFKDQLLHAAGVPETRILEYSCGHVIEADHILPIALARGTSGLELDFTFQNRGLPEVMDELGRVVYNVCNVVPGGVVCFFPSYEYEKNLYTHWEKTGFLNRLSSKKQIFREPKKASQADQILTSYANSIKKAKSAQDVTGALLMCVVGGKMSEGINFSDDLGRCVIMVGLPYPNKFSPELKEKIEYLNANMPKHPDGRSAGQLHYENLCMKAVNQSIGRAIRHKDDYAAILLLDHRYLRPSMRTKLPGWIATHMHAIEKFGPALSEIKHFFAAKSRS